MKGRGRQTLSITLRTDAHAATNRVSHPDTRPITPQFTPPLFTFINTYIITPYVSVCHMRSNGRCVSFHHKNKAIMKKTVFLAADICHSAATKVDEADIVINNPSELMIIIPALPAGTYQLEVTTQYSMGKQWLKEPRTRLFEKTLTVK